MHKFDRMKAAAFVHPDAWFEIEDKFRPHHIPETRRMGLVAPHTPRLSIEEYIVSEVEPPAAVHRRLPSGNDAWLNDQISDCGPAAVLNGIQTFDSEAGRPTTPFTDADAELFYSEEAGYVPGNPATDQGTDNAVMVRHWENPGVLCKATGERHKIVASVFVPYTEQMTKLAIWEFVVCFRAYGLPATAEQQKHWQLVGDGKTGASAPGSWGYHDIAQTSYGPYNVGLKTWGQPWMAAWDFDTTYAVQGFVAITQEMTNLQGVSPAGIDWTKLNADLAKLPSGPNF